MLALAYALNDASDSDVGNDEARLWLEKAAKAGSEDALAELGLWQMVGHRQIINKEAAFDLLTQAAKQGHIRAGLLRATAYAQGDGTLVSYSKAVSQLIQLAKKEEATALRQLAFLLKPIPRFDKLRTALYANAAQQGDIISCYFLGKHLCAETDPQQNMLGRGWLQIASEAGNWCAHNLLKSMEGEKLRRPTATSTASVKIPWNDLPRYLALPHERKTNALKILSTSPKIQECKDFLSSDETDYLISTGETFLEAATVNDETLGQIKDETRTNSFANFYFMESDVITASINAHIVKTAGAMGHGGDPLSLLHYTPGQTYKPHYDFFDPAYPAHIAPLKKDGQRIKTLLVYLNDNYAGGETAFPKIDLAYKGNKGDLLMFDNLDTNGQIDRKTLHSGNPTSEGEKWLLSKWIRSPA
jgi:hypothetical protein